ncbi:Chemotaxis response regulator protein-glutamate methylesterase [bioreactor metagenome]|uniref:Chemotaxis response regulator protein-glutamate methylesterase n=1 Tax=bioreactor metagenome TaxID=1076179 RepID=A0A644Z811_9ZZZZ
MDRVEFQNDVKDILNHLSDPAYLENHGLLVLFYTGPEAPLTARMRSLRETIQGSIEFLRPPEGTPENATEWRCFKILNSRYFQMKEWHVIEEEMGLSQRQVQRDLKKGLDALISILWDHYVNQNATDAASAENAEGEEAYDNELIQEELKNWEISYDLVNLSQILEQALQLCKSLSQPHLQDHLDMLEVDTNLNVMVDQVLTKQGLYKIISMFSEIVEDQVVQIKTRKVNDFFYDLTFRFRSPNDQALEHWKIAQLFFTIQSLRHAILEEDGTTTISIILPVKKQVNCLVIDDVESVRRLIERMLGSYGIQVFGADNYTSAINLIQLVKPDFILLDVLMPKMDGWQMIKNFKSNPDTAGIPVIISSVLYEPELSQAVNAVGYIRKPINRLELIKTLQDLNLIKVDEA